MCIGADSPIQQDLFDINAEQIQKMKRLDEVIDRINRMQETNGELNKSLSKLTVQNTQAAKDLNDARERQRQLERQLQESSGSGLWKIAAIIAILAFLASLFFR